MKYLWGICAFFGVIGLLDYLMGLGQANSAPQQAAAAAMAMAWAVIPYCICRAIQQIKSQDASTKKEE